MLRSAGAIAALRPDYENAVADCSVSSEPRKNTIFPSAKRHQCCMCIAARLPVARLHEISSIYGHDAFLKESDQLRGIFAAALGSVA